MPRPRPPAKLCLVEACDRPARTRGWCHGHYCRWLRNGDPGAQPIAPYGSSATNDHRAPCKVDGCHRARHSKGLCQAHYLRWRRNDGETGDGPIASGAPALCSIEGCNKLRKARGWCAMHYMRWTQHGDPHVVSKRTPAYRHVTSAGYVLVKRPEHPNASQAGYVAEHVLVMSEHLGRPLEKGEEVHHRFGDRADNRLEALELWTSSHPAGKRVRDAIEHALWTIEKYGSDPSRY